MSRLLELILDMDNLRAAWEEVAENKGLPGVDNVSIRRWERNWEERLVALAEAVRTNRYQPARLRLRRIRKRGETNGESCASLRLLTVYCNGQCTMCCATCMSHVSWIAALATDLGEGCVKRCSASWICVRGGWCGYWMRTLTLFSTMWTMGCSWHGFVRT